MQTLSRRSDIHIIIDFSLIVSSLKVKYNFFDRTKINEFLLKISSVLLQNSIKLEKKKN